MYIYSLLKVIYLFTCKYIRTVLFTGRDFYSSIQTNSDICKTSLRSLKITKTVSIQRKNNEVIALNLQCFRDCH